MRVEPLPRATASSSRTTSRAATIPKEYHPADPEGHDGSARRRNSRRLPDGRTSRLRCSTAAITTSTRRKWRSRSAGSMAIKEACRRPSRSCWSRSWRWKWWCRKSTWAPSIGDLISRRGQHRRHGNPGDHADHSSRCVPLSRDVRVCDRTSLAHAGTRQFHHALRRYEEVPRSVSEEIVNKIQGKITK